MLNHLARIATVVACVALCGCAKFQKAEVPVTDLGACILARAAADFSESPQPSSFQIVADVVAFCKTDEATVLQALTSVRKASQAQGMSFLNR